MTHVWPVIHFHTAELAYTNAQKAVDAGAAGVFLIHMDGEDHLLDPVGQELLRRHPHVQIGVNYLSLDAPAALARALVLGYAASWADRPGVRSDGTQESALRMAELLKEHPSHRFFASVAFKYQPVDDNPGEAARRTLDLGMTPTTSGTATGYAPSEEKLAAIRRIIGSKSAKAPLALASGVSPENATRLAPHLTDILVSTGVSSSFYELDAGLLGELVRITNTL